MKQLGMGGQAQVDLYADLTDSEQHYAVKTFQIRKNSSSIKEIYREI